MQLYNITENLKQVEQMIAEGADPEQLQDAIYDIDEAFEENAGNILFILKNMESSIESIKSEEKRLAQRRKTIENQLEGLKEYLVRNMAETGRTKVSNDLMTASYIKPKPMLVVDDEDAIGSDYRSIKVTTSLDKKRILDELKDGKEIEGAHIGESKAGLKFS